VTTTVVVAETMSVVVIGMAAAVTVRVETGIGYLEVEYFCAG
jgi:hypothetical protein